MFNGKLTPVTGGSSGIGVLSRNCNAGIMIIGEKATGLIKKAHGLA